MKKLLLSALLGLGLVLPALAMDGQDLKITRTRIDFENSQFIEFSDLVAYKSEHDALFSRCNASNGTKIGILCKINQGGRFHIVEDIFMHESWWIDWGIPVNLKSQQIISMDTIYKNWQSFENLSIEGKSKFLAKIKAECEEKCVKFRILNRPSIKEMFCETAGIYTHNTYYIDIDELDRLQRWILAAVDYLASVKTYSNEEKIILNTCLRILHKLNIGIRENHKLKFVADLITAPVWVPALTVAGTLKLMFGKKQTCQDGLALIFLGPGMVFTALEIIALIALVSYLKNKKP
jgi:hypothetical protein